MKCCCTLEDSKKVGVGEDGSGAADGDGKVGTCHSVESITGV